MLWLANDNNEFMHEIKFNHWPHLLMGTKNEEFGKNLVKSNPPRVSSPFTSSVLVVGSK